MNIIKKKRGPLRTPLISFPSSIITSYNPKTKLHSADTAVLLSLNETFKLKDQQTEESVITFLDDIIDGFVKEEHGSTTTGHHGDSIVTETDAKKGNGQSTKPQCKIVSKKGHEFEIHLNSTPLNDRTEKILQNDRTEKILQNNERKRKEDSLGRIEEDPKAPNSKESTDVDWVHDSETLLKPSQIKRRVKNEKLASSVLLTVEKSGKQVSAYSKQVSVPGKQVSVPGKQVSVPGKQVSVSEKQVSVSEKQVSVSEKQVSVPDKQVSVPDKQVSVSGKRGREKESITVVKPPVTKKASRKPKITIELLKSNHKKSNESNNGIFSNPVSFPTPPNTRHCKNEAADISLEIANILSSGGVELSSSPINDVIVEKEMNSPVSEESVLKSDVTDSTNTTLFGKRSPTYIPNAAFTFELYTTSNKSGNKTEVRRAYSEPLKDINEDDVSDENVNKNNVLSSESTPTYVKTKSDSLIPGELLSSLKRRLFPKFSNSSLKNKMQTLDPSANRKPSVIIHRSMRGFDSFCMY